MATVLVQNGAGDFSWTLSENVFGKLECLADREIDGNHWTKWIKLKLEMKDYREILRIGKKSPKRLKVYNSEQLDRNLTFDSWQLTDLKLDKNLPEISN